MTPLRTLQDLLNKHLEEKKQLHIKKGRLELEMVSVTEKLRGVDTVIAGLDILISEEEKKSTVKETC